MSGYGKRDPENFVIFKNVKGLLGHISHRLDTPAKIEELQKNIARQIEAAAETLVKKLNGRPLGGWSSKRHRRRFRRAAGETPTSNQIAFLTSIVPHAATATPKIGTITKKRVGDEIGLACMAGHSKESAADRRHTSLAVNKAIFCQAQGFVLFPLMGG